MHQFIRFLNSIKKVLVWILIAFVLALLISNRHSKSGTFNWMTPLWADQAGYYVYLPGLFIYDFDAKSFPKKIEEKTIQGYNKTRPTDREPYDIFLKNHLAVDPIFRPNYELLKRKELEG